MQSALVGIVGRSLPLSPSTCRRRLITHEINRELAVIERRTTPIPAAIPSRSRVAGGRDRRAGDRAQARRVRSAHGIGLCRSIGVVAVAFARPADHRLARRNPTHLAAPRRDDCPRRPVAQRSPLRKARARCLVAKHHPQVAGDDERSRHGGARGWPRRHDHVLLDHLRPRQGRR